MLCPSDWPEGGYALIGQRGGCALIGQDVFSEWSHAPWAKGMSADLEPKMIIGEGWLSSWEPGTWQNFQEMSPSGVQMGGGWPRHRRLAHIPSSVNRQHLGGPCQGSPKTYFMGGSRQVRAFCVKISQASYQQTKSRRIGEWICVCQIGRQGWTHSEQRQMLKAVGGYGHKERRSNKL